MERSEYSFTSILDRIRLHSPFVAGSLKSFIFLKKILASRSSKEETVLLLSTCSISIEVILSILPELLLLLLLALSPAQ